MRKKLKILIIMTVALGASSLMSNTVFIAATPYINKPFLAQVVRSPGVVIQNTRDYIASIGQGKQGVQQYQQQRIESYIAEQSSGGEATGSLAALPPPRGQDDFEARGYAQTAQGVYAKQDVSANTIEFYFNEDARFEKRTVEVNGESVEAWVLQ